MSIAYLQLGLTKLHADILCIVAIEQTCTKSRRLVDFGPSVVRSTDVEFAREMIIN